MPLRSFASTDWSHFPRIELFSRRAASKERTSKTSGSPPHDAAKHRETSYGRDALKRRPDVEEGANRHQANEEAAHEAASDAIAPVPLQDTSIATVVASWGSHLLTNAGDERRLLAREACQKPSARLTG
jgi:hypothetical protein